MKNMLHIIGFVGLIAQATSLFGFIESINFGTLDQKQCCLLGEFHRILYVPGSPGSAAEERDKSGLFKFIHGCSSSNKPVAFILETSDHVNQRFQEVTARINQSQPSPIGLILALPLFAQQHNKRLDNLHFIYADIRGPAQKMLTEGLGIIEGEPFLGNLAMPLILALKTIIDDYDYEMQQPIVNFISHPCPETMDTILRMRPATHKYFFGPQGPFSQFKTLFNWMGKGYLYSVNTLFTELAQARQMLEDALPSLDESSPCHRMLQQNLTKIDEATGKATQFFDRYLGTSAEDREKPYIDAVFNAIERDLFKTIQTQWLSWAGQLSNEIADAGFTITLHRCLQEYDNIIFFGGNNHALVLGDLTRQLGFSPVSPFPQENLDRNMFCQTGTLESRFSDSQMNKMLRTIQQRILGETAPSTSSNPAIEKKCAACNKTEGKLLRCSRCKQTYYCSTTCQKVDWQIHKQTCTKK